jgi:hypothetical protein
MLALSLVDCPPAFGLPRCGDVDRFHIECNPVCLDTTMTSGGQIPTSGSRVDERNGREERSEGTRTNREMFRLL